MRCWSRTTSASARPAGPLSASRAVGGWRSCRGVRPARKRSPRPRRLRRYAVAASVLLAVGLSAWGVRQTFFAVPAGSRASVQSVSGALHRLDGGRALALAPGASSGRRRRRPHGARLAGRAAAARRLERRDERAGRAVGHRPRATTRRSTSSGAASSSRRRSAAAGTCSSPPATARSRSPGRCSRSTAGSRARASRCSRARCAWPGGGDETVLARGDQWTTSDAVGEVPLARRDRLERRRRPAPGAARGVEGAARRSGRAVEMPGVRYESRLLSAHARGHGGLREPAQLRREPGPGPPAVRGAPAGEPGPARLVAQGRPGAPRRAEPRGRDRQDPELLRLPGRRGRLRGRGRGTRASHRPAAGGRGAPARDCGSSSRRSWRAPRGRRTGRRCESWARTAVAGASAGEAALFVLLRPGLVAVATDEKDAAGRWTPGGRAQAPASTGRRSGSASSRRTRAAWACSSPRTSNA